MSTKPQFEFIWVKKTADLAALAELLAKEEVISVDTETSGWQTGNERLCLIQIGIPSQKLVALIDTLEEIDLSPLAKALGSERPWVVAHNASFEKRQFDRYDIKIGGVRDTLTLARELRPDLPNHTLRTCSKLLLGIEINKEEQTSDWSIRPLTDSQIDYARLDAEIALTLHDYLWGLEKKANEDLERAVSELVRDYADATRKRFDLMKEVSNEVAYLVAREAKLKETIRRKLIDGEPAYDGPYGKASVVKVKRTEVNPDKVRSVFPEFASRVIKDAVDRKDFDAVAKEFGLPKSAIESVLDVTGFNDRLTLSIKDDVGELE